MFSEMFEELTRRGFRATESRCAQEPSLIMLLATRSSPKERSRTFPDYWSLAFGLQSLVTSLCERIQGLFQSLSGGFQILLRLGVCVIAVGIELVATSAEQL